MKITNKNDLPDSLVKAVTYSNYSKPEGHYSVTGLLNPPRISVLKKLHEDELEEDASDRLWALMGSAGHEVLRRAAVAMNSKLVEHRMNIELAGAKISGQIDLIDGEGLIDFKFTSIWVTKDGQPKPEWVEQMNCYRYLLWKTKELIIDKLTIVTIFRDWSMRESKRDSKYPQSQAMKFNLPVWPFDQTEKFISDRVKLHQDASKVLPECSPDDRWAKPPVWALMKEGRKTAVKLYYDSAAAGHHLNAAGTNHRIDYRPGENIRCESYCVVAPFCEQFKRLKAEQVVSRLPST